MHFVHMFPCIYDLRLLMDWENSTFQGHPNSTLLYLTFFLVQPLTILSLMPGLLFVCLFIYLFLFSVDLIPMLCERAGLPQGTPMAMFEVSKDCLYL